MTKRLLLATLLATASQSTIVRFWKDDVLGTNPTRAE